ncbi:MAG: FtsX-like permease family protein, partial [Acidobacteria bacterium]|nr:FtsX-like permease family protein [Acidobacteriota bacterium]
LLLARASSRSKELAIRSALGSSRGRVVLQLLADSLLIALIGGVLGIVVLRACIAWLNSVLAVLDPPFWFYIEIDAGILAFVFAVALASAVVAGLFPALQATRANLNEILSDSARGGTSLRLGMLSRSLVVLEITFATALLLCAGLTIRTVINLQNLDLAFDPEGIQTARIYPAESVVSSDGGEVGLFYRRLLEGLEARPEVAWASLGSSVPTNGAGRARYAVDGEVFPDEETMPRARFFTVTPGYFNTFHIPALEGRLLDARDTAEGLPVALVNHSLAEREWPGESAVGRRIRFGRGEGDPWHTVVGVVPDQLLNLQDQDTDLSGAYLPFVQSPQRGMAVVLEGRGGTQSLNRAVSEELARLAPDESPYSVLTMSELLDRNTFQNRVLGIIFSAFAGAAVLLTGIGLYGVMAFAVGQRTQEIGVRMAFGARRGQILGLVLRQGLRQTLLGLAMGWVLAYGLARLLSIALYQVAPSDPPSYLGTTLLLGSIAMLACAVPARRAAGMDPVRALREN